MIDLKNIFKLTKTVVCRLNYYKIWAIINSSLLVTLHQSCRPFFYSRSICE